MSKNRKPAFLPPSSNDWKYSLLIWPGQAYSLIQTPKSLVRGNVSHERSLQSSNLTTHSPSDGGQTRVDDVMSRGRKELRQVQFMFMAFFGSLLAGVLRSPFSSSVGQGWILLQVFACLITAISFD
ncbi:hypothetical protein DL96DRAFT_1645958, partial [Flagelloscypha sp. PMI_526]